MLDTHTPLQLPTPLTEHPRVQATQPPVYTVPSRTTGSTLRDGAMKHEHCHLPSEGQGSVSPPPPPQHRHGVLRNAYL